MARRIQGEAKRNRKDHGFKVPPGKTLQEHTEDQLRAAVKNYYRIRDEAVDDRRAYIARGVVRGLAWAVLIHRNSYRLDDKKLLLKIERDFLEEGKR